MHAFIAPTASSPWTTLKRSFPCITEHSHTCPSFSSAVQRRVFMAINLDSDVAFTVRGNASEGFLDSNVSATFGFADPEFAKAVSGEWFGYECAFFVRDGEPMNIPERYIPDDFRQWGVEVKGFESVTSSQTLEDKSLLVKRTRALPSVGCEADAVVPEVAEHIFLSVDGKSINGGFPDGTFSCGPASISEPLSQRWNVCLVDPSKGNKSRARLEFGFDNEPFGVVTVFLEHWDAPFCRGAVLPGCGGKSQSFATDSALQPSVALPGIWAVESLVYTFGSGGWKCEHTSSVLERTISSASQEITVALPRGVSVGFITAADGARTVVAGWMTDNNLRIVSRRKYDPSGVLISVSRAVERRQS